MSVFISTFHKTCEVNVYPNQPGTFVEAYHDDRHFIFRYVPEFFERTKVPTKNIGGLIAAGAELKVRDPEVKKGTLRLTLVVERAGRPDLTMRLESYIN